MAAQNTRREHRNNAAHADVAVVCAADRNYALPLAVTLRSAASHLHTGANLDAYIIDDGIPPADRQRLADSLPENVRIHRLPPHTLAFADLPTWGRMPRTTYQKLALGELLPRDLDRVIWLDGDLLVRGDLCRLWSVALGNATVAACQDQRIPRVSSPQGLRTYRQLGIHPDTKYFNAGVLLIDLRRWRTEHVFERAIDYLADNARHLYFWDQEALNAVLAHSRAELDDRWNWNPVVGELMRRRPRPLTAGEPDDPWILHFSGNIKPWIHRGRGPAYDLYRIHLERTAWAGSESRAGKLHELFALYETSRLRRWLYPSERWGTELVRAATMRKHSRR